MAEITQSSAGHGSGSKAPVKKRSTKVDMTPMVDLAFLLLTFFILTTSFHKAHVMEVTMPDPTGGSAPVNAENVLNLVLGEDDKIYWWMASHEDVQLTNYSSAGVRKLLLEKVRQNPALIVLIKPTGTSVYGNMVDILDEMEITGVGRFAVVEFAEEDRRAISAGDPYSR